MNSSARIHLRHFIEATLAEEGDQDLAADTESLFFSGRLNSLAVMKLVAFLESAFGLDFGKVAFDLARLDSIREIECFVDETAPS